ncbi:MAG TPA: hypothetical protein H9812_07630 [Candidatus Gallimonas intestinigallinarum]|uniref:Uncharacterized protein n=1 Tax=Candidatus Gallimonas intestinigallinarum TaxID=2838604 RepID=A0A9D2DYB7_9FIRM|nr:hypothetical protein [Candidatus Gallimonas intestinigallinarum]
MLGLYSKKDVEKLVDRLREEYEEALRTQRQAAEELKEENRNLAARVSQLEAERATVADALIDAVKAGERIRKESEDAAANGGKELSLLIAKCRLLSGNLMAKYPDAEDVKAFSDFVEALQSEASEEEDGLDMDEVLAPKYPLDLGKLCKELGLMEDKEQETEEA